MKRNKFSRNLNNNEKVELGRFYYSHFSQNSARIQDKIMTEKILKQDFIPSKTLENPRILAMVENFLAPLYPNVDFSRNSGEELLKGKIGRQIRHTINRLSRNHPMNSLR